MDMTDATFNRVAIPLDLSASAPVSNGRLRELAGQTMGTTWTVKFIGTEATAQTLLRAVNIVLDRVIAQMSPWLPTSDLSRFNTSPDLQAFTPPDEFAAVISAGLRIASETDGAYDPAMAVLVNLWGFGPTPRARDLPTQMEIEHAREKSGWQHLVWAPAPRSLHRTKPVALDLNGIAKGYAVDLVMAVLNTHGVHHALVEIGGELKGSGMKEDGTPWWVSIARPDTGLASDLDAPLLIALHGLAIATSGCERGFQSGGIHYAHTIDPRTGMPLRNDMISASVLHPSCMDADAYATAFMVMGADTAMAFAARMDLAAVILCTSPGGDIVERISPALQAMLD